MKAARHSSVSAHLAYMSSDVVTEGKKIAGLLRRNNAVQEPKKEEVPKPLDTCMSKSAWRHFTIQGMVNDPNVTLQESMKAARHSNVSAHLAYMKEEVPKPLDTCMSKSTHEPIKIFEEPENTQDELAAFQEEYRQLELSAKWPQFKLKMSSIRLCSNPVLRCHKSPLLSVIRHHQNRLLKLLGLVTKR